ncbi:trans-sulfuration enzyme family protein [Quadrisphaera sp. GCM10027208]|uniref:trans-sulfuration enzyme family protein n=1 Tax=Quadrisphaera sp. GCM10027208 TaxID=3273423 RepID=UPI0036109EB8
MDPRWSPATRAVVAGRPPRRPDAPLTSPPVLSSTFVASEDPAARGYGRYANPTWEDFESALGGLEGGAAVTFASGMAAVSAVVEVALARRRTAGEAAPAVVVPTAAYNTTLALLDELAAADRLTVRRVDVTDAEAVTAALDGATLLWLESPTNPMLEVADVAACCAAATRHGATAVVDSTFATPLRQLPLTLGADVVVHSATKLLAGHSDVLLGAAVTADPDLAAALRRHRTLHGAVPGPWEVWLALRGLRTVHLRVDRAEASARELAERLRGHRAVERVRYPGWGTMVSVEVRGGAQAADRVVAGVALWVPATSLGGVESTLERRRRHAAEPPVVPESLVRLSVGVEDVEDLWADLRAALDDAAG